MVAGIKTFVSIVLTVIMLSGCSDSDSTSDANTESFVWNSPVALESNGIGSTQVQLAADPSGNVMATWVKIDLPRGDGYSYKLNASRYDAQSRSWSAAAPIENQPGYVDFLRGAHKLAALPDGSFLMLWTQLSPTASRVFFNIWDPNIGEWRGEQEVTSNPGVLRNSQLVVSPDGRALAIWTNSYDNTGPTSDLFGCWFKAQDGTWGTPFHLENLPGSSNVFFPQLIQAKFLENNDLVVVWPHYDGTQSLLVANHYQEQEGSWSGTTTLAAGSFFPYSITQDSQGNLLLAWTDFAKIYTKMLKEGSVNWESDVIHADIGTSVAYPPGDSVSSPVLFSSPDGNTYLAWEQTLDGNDQFYLQRWLPVEQVWQDPAETSLKPDWFISTYLESEGILSGVTVESDGWSSHLSRQSWDLVNGSVSEPVRFNEGIGNVGGRGMVNLPDGKVMVAWSQAPPDISKGGEGIVAAMFGPPESSTSTTIPAISSKRELVWEMPFPFDSGHTFIEDLQLVRDATGDLHAIWKYHSTAARNQPSLLTSRMDNSSGTWLPTETLIDAGSFYDTTIKPLPPDGLLAVWENGGLLYSSSYSPDSGWSGSSALPIPMVRYGWDYDVNMAGGLTVLWEENNGNEYQLFSSTRNPSDMTWSPAVLLDTGGGSLQRVVSLVDGGAMAFWTAFGDPNPEEDLYASRFDPISATWTSPELITAGVFNVFSDLTVLSDDNNVYLGWVSLQGGNYVPFVRRYDLTSSSWTVTQQLLPASGDTWEMLFTKGQLGKLIVGMNRVEGSLHDLLMTEYNPLTDTWLPTQTIFESSERFFNLQLVTEPNGRLTATWEQWDGNKSKVLTSTRTEENSPWSAAEVLNSPDHEAWNPNIALNADNLPAATWSEVDPELATISIRSLELSP